MNDRQFRALASYEKILRAFQAGILTSTPEIVVLLQQLRETVKEITSFAQKQYDAKYAFIVTRARVQLDALRKEQMLPLARGARRHFRGEARIMVALKVPHKNAPSDTLLAAAELLVRTVRPHRAFLAKAGVDMKRLPRLASDVRQLKKTFKTAYANAADRGAPTRQLPALFGSAHENVLAIESLVLAKPADRTIPAAWKKTKRMSKRIGRPRRPKPKRTE